MSHVKRLATFFLFTIVLVMSVVPYTYSTEVVSSQKTLEKVLAQHKGQVIYLDFWASWCGPCVKSFPWMNAIQAKYQAKGFVVISVNLDANGELAAKFLVENPASFDVVYDPKGKIAKHFSIKGMPSSMLIDRNGAIKYKHTGFFTSKIPTYEKEIEDLLNQK
ncbi:MAG: TlpA family protein disulfide reductase [Colwellia sp.]